jgi:polar amino acid transport system substrate-binding protein
MGRDAVADQLSLALTTARATPRQRRVALALAVLFLLAFAAAVPFARVHLPKVPAFIPIYQTALFIIDFVTAALLCDQFLRLRSTGLLVLMAGYLFDALIIVSHTLSFPGAFSQTGLLGSGPQTTAWLYIFWHGGFSIFVIAYALLRNRAGLSLAHVSPTRAVGLTALVVIALVTSLTLLATWGHDLLPVVMQGSDYSLLVSKGISPAIWLLTLAGLIALHQRDLKLMDLWLMLVMWVWLFDIGLAAVLGSSRFDLGFYAGRIFGLFAAACLMIALLAEVLRLYARAVDALVEVKTKPASSEAVPLVGAFGKPIDNGRSRPNSVEAFIRDKNIAHYRSLLDSGKVGASEREVIERLLFQEEHRDRHGASRHANS